MKKGGFWRLVVVSISVGLFSQVTGIIWGLLGYIATDYDEVTQCFVWVVNVLLCMLIIGGITLLILRKRKHYFFGESAIKKIKYIVGTFCFAYIISAVIVIIGKGSFNITYVTTLIAVEFFIGIVGGLIAWLTNKTKNMEESSLQVTTQRKPTTINEPAKQKLKQNSSAKKKSKKRRK